MNDTTFNNQFECLDIQGFEMNDDEYREEYNDTIVKVQIVKFSGGYTHYISVDPCNYISIHKSYYEDGKIEEKGLFNDLGFQQGKWYKFNSRGILTETIDMDQGFNFTFEKLKEELIKEESLSFNNLPSKNTGNWGNEYPISIRRFSEPAPRWYVSFPDTTNSANGAWGTNIKIIYDGRTGDRISKEFREIM